MSSFSRVFKKFPSTFWWANTMELFERLAWYGIFVVLANYLTGSTDTGALGFSQIQKGTLMGVVTALVYFFPTITGAIADKFGFKNTLIAAYLVLASGYFFMGQVSSYPMVFLAFLWVGVGAGLFKPVIQATIGKTTDNETSSIGFGIFYMMVNIGSFIGPIIVKFLRGYDWSYAFMMSSVAIVINLVILLIFFKEPPQEKNTEALGKSIISIFKNIGRALSDLKLSIFLILMVGFWTMYNQLFYTLPVFIEQWVHTDVLLESIRGFWPWLAEKVVDEDTGKVATELIINLDAMFIIFFQILISGFVMRYKPLTAMISGILVCSIGISLTLLTQNPFFLILSIFIFAVGEMASSPKTSEYIARIAPSDKVGLYMGASFLPYAGGNLFAGMISGGVYQGMSDKITLLQKEVASRGLDIQAISETFTQNDYINRACELMGMDRLELTNYLWQTYNPSKIWIVVFAIGFGTVVLLYLYDKFLLKSKAVRN